MAKALKKEGIAMVDGDDPASLSAGLNHQSPAVVMTAKLVASGVPELLRKWVDDNVQEAGSDGHQPLYVVGSLVTVLGGLLGEVIWNTTPDDDPDREGQIKAKISSVVDMIRSSIRTHIQHNAEDADWITEDEEEIERTIERDLVPTMVAVIKRIAEDPNSKNTQELAQSVVERLASNAVRLQ